MTWLTEFISKKLDLLQGTVDTLTARVMSQQEAIVIKSNSNGDHHLSQWGVDYSISAASDGGVYFYSQRITEYSKHGSVVPFEIQQLNIGRAMNLTSGVFTVSKDGTYFFSFSAIAGLDNTSVYLEKNGAVVSSAEDAKSLHPLSLQSILKLKTGDRITLRLCDVATPGALKEFDTSSRLTNFIGMSLKGDDIHSLPVYFHVQRVAYFNDNGKTINFDVIKSNYGNGMNADKGVFTAPKEGRYFFRFSGITYSEWDFVSTLELKLNGMAIKVSSTVQGHWKSIAIKHTMHLKKGDRVSLQLLDGGISKNTKSDFIGICLDDDYGSGIVESAEIDTLPFSASSFLSDDSSTVSFYVGRSSSFSSNYRMTIPFDTERQNRGKGMDLNTGVFTVGPQQSGVYYFSFLGLAGHRNTRVHLYLNGDRRRHIASAFGLDSKDTLLFQSILKLTSGDTISLFLDQGSIHNIIYFYGVFLSQ